LPNAFSTDGLHGDGNALSILEGDDGEGDATMSSATAVRASLVGESDGAGAAAGNCHVSGDMWSIDADRQRIGNSAFFDAAWSPKILAPPPAHHPNLAWS